MNKTYSKWVCGPGGIKCPCCRSTSSVSKAKRLHRRTIRRKEKIETKENDSLD